MFIANKAIRSQTGQWKPWHTKLGGRCSFGEATMTSEQNSAGAENNLKLKSGETETLLIEVPAVDNAFIIGSSKVTSALNRVWEEHALLLL